MRGEIRTRKEGDRWRWAIHGRRDELLEQGRAYKTRREAEAAAHARAEELEHERKGRAALTRAQRPPAKRAKRRGS